MLDIELKNGFIVLERMPEDISKTGIILDDKTATPFLAIGKVASTTTESEFEVGEIVRCLIFDTQFLQMPKTYKPYIYTKEEYVLCKLEKEAWNGRAVL